MPKTSASKTTSDFAPLLKVLRQIESRLEREGETRILVAAKNRKEFERQKLESHQIVTPCKLQGPRVPVRDRRRIGQLRAIAARWPNDHLLEATQPTFNIVLSGQTDVRIANYSVHCQPGDTVLFPASTPKTDGSLPAFLHATPASTCSILMFSPGLVAGTGLECSIGHWRGQEFIAGNIDERCWVKSLEIAQLYSMLCQQLEGNGNTKSTFHIFMALLIQLQQEIKTGKAMVAWPFVSVKTPQDEEKLIGHAMKYINDHLEGHLTIDIVAHQMGVSRTVLTREFRNSAKSTFTNYLIGQRMKQAEVLLKEVNFSVKRVSRAVGLSPRRLRGLFQERHQCSPDEFRNS